MSKDCRYPWDYDKPPEIEFHSLAKHEVLGQYIERYIEVLTQNHKVDCLRMTLVDAFAGGGIYRRPGGCLHYGSPIIMLEAVERSKIKLKAEGRRCELCIQFIFVEKDRRAIECLRQVLQHSQFRGRIDDSIFILEGAFAEYAPAIQEKVRKTHRFGRALFLLDQYGYTDVPLDLLKDIFRAAPKAEILFTFAVDWLKDFLTDSDRSRQAIANSGLALNHADLIKLRDSGIEGIIQAYLHKHLREGIGASHFTPFFIVPSDSRKRLWLVHLSNHARARDEMTRLHWSLKNRFEHFGGAGLDMFRDQGVSLLGYDPRIDFERLGQMSFKFDDSARARTMKELEHHLPDYLFRSARAGITFGSLFDNVVNTTPATSNIISEALFRLEAEGEVHLLGPGGRPLQRDRELTMKDIVKPVEQRPLVCMPARRLPPAKKRSDAC